MMKTETQQKPQTHILQKHSKHCCGESENKKIHPDHSAQLGRLNRVIGQLQGVKRMIEGQRYCPDILVQTRAASSALKSIELGILERHLEHCVHETLMAPSQKEAQKKLKELMEIVGRF